MTKARTTIAAFDWADPLVLDDTLTDEEKLVRDSIRRFCQDELQPRISASLSNSSSRSGEVSATIAGLEEGCGALGNIRSIIT